MHRNRLVSALFSWMNLTRVVIITSIFLCVAKLISNINENCHKEIVKGEKLHPIKMNSRRFVLSDPKSPRLCVIVRTYEDQIEYFTALAFTLRNSGFKNIRVYVINTDTRTNITRLRETLNFINTHTGEDFVEFIDFGSMPSKNQHGYGVTDQALQYLYDLYAKDPQQCRYLLVTNGDNLYSNSLAKYVIPHISKSIDIISWGFVSHYGSPKLRINTAIKSTQKIKYVDDGSNKCVVPTLSVGYIDLSAVIYRFELLYKKKMFYRVHNGSYSFTADGEFVERLLKTVNTAVVIAQTLVFHQ